MADETEVPRLIGESLDRALRICRSIAGQDEDVALVFAQLGDRRARAGLAALLDRRIAAPSVLSRFLSSGPRDLTVSAASHRGAVALLDVFAAMRGGLDLRKRLFGLGARLLAVMRSSVASGGRASRVVFGRRGRSTCR